MLQQEVSGCILNHRYNFPNKNNSYEGEFLVQGTGGMSPQLDVNC